MTGLSNQYFEGICESVRLKPIPWENYSRADIISSVNAELFKSLDKQVTANHLQTLKGDQDQYANALLQSLSADTKADLKRHFLLLLGDVCMAEPTCSFIKIVGSNNQIWQTFQAILANSEEDQDTKILCARFVSQYASTSIIPYDVLEALYNFVGSSLLSNEQFGLEDLGVQFLSLALQNSNNRAPFWESQQKSVERLQTLIRTPDVVQLQYYSLLILWMLTFDKSIAADIVTKYDILSVLLWAAKSTLKENVARVSIAAILSLMDAAPKTAPIALIAQRALPIVNIISERKWADVELASDLKTLRERLTATFDNMSTFEVYKSELKSKHLQWSPPHKSQQFWKQNIAEFRKDDWRVLQQLLELLNNATDDPVTQAVACNDVSNIIAVAPDAVLVLRKGVTKARIMALLDSSDPEVRYEALKATQAFLGHMFEV